MIEVKAINTVGGECGYRIIVEEEGLYIKDGGQTVFIDMGDIEDVIDAIAKTYNEYQEYSNWRNKNGRQECNRE